MFIKTQIIALFLLISVSSHSQSLGLKPDNFLSLNGYGNAYLLSAFGKPANSQDFEERAWMFSEPASGMLMGVLVGGAVGFSVAGLTKDSDSNPMGLAPGMFAAICAYPLGCATGIFFAGKLFESERGSFLWTLLGCVTGTAIDLLTGLKYPVFSTIGGLVVYRLTLEKTR